MGGKFSWPRLDNVVEYRRKVRNIILMIIEETSLELPITMENPWVPNKIDIPLIKQPINLHQCI